MGERSTIANHKKIDAKNGESLSDTVIRILEASLHHRSVDFDYDDTSQSSDQHPVVISACRGSTGKRQPTSDDPIDQSCI